MNDFLILYILHHKACIAGAEYIGIPASDEWSIYIHILNLHATLGPRTQQCTTRELLKLICSMDPHSDAQLCTCMASNLMDEVIS